MPRLDVEIPTSDGVCPATLHVPDGGVPAPAVILFPDTGGVRETLRQMADRLAGTGYVTLLPDLFYRSAPWAPFDLATVFAEPAERDRLMTMARSVSADMTDRDADGFPSFMAGRPEVSGGLVGTTGYCMGGRMSLMVAGGHPERIGAAASFHGGMLAVADSPGSPHLRADRIRAAVYVAAAENDGSFPSCCRRRTPTRVARRVDRPAWAPPDDRRGARHRSRIAGRVRQVIARHTHSSGP